MQLLIDIETLDVAPSAVITEISWAPLDQPWRIETIHINPWDQIATGRTVDKATVSWRIAKAPRLHVTHSMRDGDLLPHALRHLARAWAGAEIVWAWGIDFERPILTHAFDQCGLTALMPEYWKFRCARTIWKTVFPHKKPRIHTHASEEDVQASIADLHEALIQIPQNAKHADP